MDIRGYIFEPGFTVEDVNKLLQTLQDNCLLELHTVESVLHDVLPVLRVNTCSMCIDINFLSTLLNRLLRSGNT